MTLHSESRLLLILSGMYVASKGEATKAADIA